MKAAGKKAPDVIDVAPVGVTEDEQLTVTDGGAIAAWVRGLRQFFGTAQALEVAALETLAKAQALQAPKDAAADEAIQRFVKQTTADRKVVEAHWEITSVIHRFHRRLTAKRDVATKAIEQANAIGNRLHTSYVEAEKRRAAAEEQRLRDEREFLARQERQAELDRLEADAVAAEEASPDLSARETGFVDAFVHGLGVAGNGQACATRAGYADPLKSAARLLSNAKIQMAIKVKQQAAAIRRQAVAKAAAPVEVEHVEVRPEITRAAGASDRTTWGGEVIDAAATIEAFRSGQYGIPGDLFMINPAKLNEYGRSLHERLDLWPGVRHTKTTTVV